MFRLILSLLALSLFLGCGDSTNENPVDNATAVGVVQYPTPAPPAAPTPPGFVPGAGYTP